MKMIFCFLIVNVCFSATCAEIPKEFYRAINYVEAGGREGRIVGDSGRALGGYQIHKVVWQDVKHKVKGEYVNCTNNLYSEKILLAYCLKYEADAVRKGDLESLARLWNSGPNWRKKKSLTNGYWTKVKSALNKKK